MEYTSIILAKFKTLLVRDCLRIFTLKISLSLSLAVPLFFSLPPSSLPPTLTVMKEDI